jgi:hypothetical protein
VAPSGVTVAGPLELYHTILSPNGSATSRRHRAAQREWLSAPKPDWLTEDIYVNKIQRAGTGHTQGTGTEVWPLRIWVYVSRVGVKFKVS